MLFLILSEHLPRPASARREDAGNGAQERLSYSEHRFVNGHTKPKSNLEVLRTVIGAVRRQFWLVAVLTVLLSALSLSLVLLLPSQFTATTLLAVDLNEPRPGGSGGTGSSCRTWSKVSTTLAPLKGGRPVSISYKMAPRA